VIIGLITRITLLRNNSEESEIVEELIKYVVQHINNNKYIYDLEAKLDIIYSDNTEKPVIIIEDLEPIIIDKIPDINLILNIILAASDAKYAGLKSLMSIDEEIIT
jgi:hypothetical protein